MPTATLAVFEPLWIGTGEGGGKLANINKGRNAFHAMYGMGVNGRKSAGNKQVPAITTRYALGTCWSAGPSRQEAAGQDRSPCYSW